MWYHAAHAVRGLQALGGASKYPASSFACGNQPPYCVIWSKPLIQFYFLLKYLGRLRLVSKYDGKQPLLACSISQSHCHSWLLSCWGKSTLNQKQTDLECASFTEREAHHTSKLSSSCTSAHQWKPTGLYKVYANNWALTLLSSLDNSSLSQTQSWRIWSRLTWCEAERSRQ